MSRTNLLVPLLVVLLIGVTRTHDVVAAGQPRDAAPVSTSTAPSPASNGTSSRVWVGGNSMFVGWLTLRLTERSGSGSYDVVWDTYVGHIRSVHYDVDVVPDPNGEVVLLLSRDGKPCSFFKGTFRKSTLRVTYPKEEIPTGFGLSSQSALDELLSMLRKQSKQQAVFYDSSRNHGALRDDSPTYNPDLVPTCP